ncbi:MAG: efflux RND transporter periplasmic adaptor subunit [Acidobacteriia bacterium]|nr:efflux RND transporter periplasmic adaptor subunit [Terriglobia bacterium]
MKNKGPQVGLVLVSFLLLLTLGGCSSAHGNPAAEAPPPVKVVSDVNVSLLSVERPEQFALSTATARATVSKLVVTGTVSPDILRSVPVISLASGRIVAIHAKLGDTVHKGQLLLQVQSSDVAGAFSDYRKAVNDERLARYQLDRAKILYDKGAISKSALETLDDAEQNAAVVLETAHEHLQLLGLDKDHPTGIVRIVAPASGVITDQQVTNAAGVQALGSNPFTISDLSSVWVVCDVYENDLPRVHVGDPAEITLNAYPDKVITGRISNIGAVLDPSIRTAKVRIEVRNPGMMRLGMFVTATFRGVKKETHTEVPASAILHLHDRDWVYVPAEDKKFRRVEVVSGEISPDQMQEVVSGLQPGARVVTNALALQHTVEQ